VIKTGYQDILKQELSKRCSQNQKYSLRAFSRYLDLQPAQLSRVLNGKQNISSAAANLIAEKLFKLERDREYFISLVELATARRSHAKERALQKIRKLAPSDSPVQLQLEVISVISDWYHFAILDLMALHDFNPTSINIASYLGISEIEVKFAVERLLKLGLLENVNGKLKKTHVKIATPNGIPSACLRKFHYQMLQKATESIETQSVNQRYLRTKTMSIARNELPKYFKLVEDFFEQVGKLVTSIEAPRKKDALYQLNLQLFDLKKQKNNRKGDN